MAKLLSIQTGLPAFYPADEQSSLGSKPWLTGFFKTPTSDTVTIGYEGITGDGQADLANHGGPDKAICVYASEHFSFWRSFLNNEQMDAGSTIRPRQPIHLLVAQTLRWATWRCSIKHSLISRSVI